MSEKPGFDVVVLGGGAGGLFAASGAAALGAKTCMIEKNKLGGDCTWYGCMPSKALLKSAHALALVKRLKDFGISSGDTRYDTGKAMSHVRDIINKVSTHHPAEVFEKRGIRVIFGNPKFIDNKTIEVNGERISAKRFIIATGSHPVVPPIPGLKEVDFLTNETVFDLNTLPKSMIVLGGGPIGVELSQAFSRLGVEVSIVEMLGRILFREDFETADVLTNVIKRDGIKIFTGKKAVKFRKENGQVIVTLEDKDKNISEIKAEKVLVAVGRAPNVQGLDLEKAGVEHEKTGIKVNEFLQTSQANIFACGDVVGPYLFSHIAAYQAALAVRNSLLPLLRQKVNYESVPWATFTDPELAHLGLTEEEAREKYEVRDLKIYRSYLKETDRAVTDMEEDGLAKVICDKKGYILGAHIVGANAGEIIHEYVIAKAERLTIGKLSSTIHIYPTLAQVVKKTADQYLLEKLGSPLLKNIAKFLMKFVK